MNAIARKLADWGVIAGLVAADSAALLRLRPAVERSWRHLPHLGHWLATIGCDKALAQLAAAALWLAALWLAIGLCAALGATLPGWPGRFAAAACRTVLPHTARNLLAGTAGLGVLLAPAAALAVSSPPASPAGMAASAPHASGTSLPAPTWPMTEPTRKPIRKPTRPTVQVRRGDCLWLLAAHRLSPDAPDAQIAAYWPRWYAANRDVVGPDPDLLHPGQVLHVPAPPAPPSH